MSLAVVFQPTVKLPDQNLVASATTDPKPLSNAADAADNLNSTLRGLKIHGYIHLVATRRLSGSFAVILLIDAFNSPMILNASSLHWSDLFFARAASRRARFNSVVAAFRSGVLACLRFIGLFFVMGVPLA
jgi:hypothetical protein